MQHRKSFLFTIVFSILSLFLISPTAFAADINDPLLKEEYQTLVNEGVIDSSVDYNTWASIYITGKEIDEETMKEILPGSGSVQQSSKSKQVVKPAYKAMKAGDIFVTNDTSANGFTGHVAIAISNTAILHMPNKNSTSTILNYSQWKSEYKKRGKKTWIFRHKDSKMAQKAADWARKNYWNSAGGGTQNLFPTYRIDTNLDSTSRSYCSKLVWQAYYKTTPRSVRKPVSHIVDPYSFLPTSFYSVWMIKPTLKSTITNY